MNNKIATLACGIGLLIGASALIFDHNQRQDACQLAINQAHSRAVSAPAVDYGKLLDDAGLTNGPNGRQVINDLPFEPQASFDSRYSAPVNICASGDTGNVVINCLLGAIFLAFCSYWILLILSKIHRVLER